MKFAIILSILAVANCSPFPKSDKTTNKLDSLILGAESNKQTITDLIEENGYPVETHQVTTSDGYVLTLHRIPYGIKAGAGPSKNKKVLFLQHGILSSSADWVIPGPGKALAYIMADNGYDVWMGNGRGNTYSRSHTTLNPDKDSQFWQFSWHQIGVIDLPTMIDYVLEQTGVEGVYYAGHSQGTTSFFVMTSSRPEYNAKIKVQVSLAPIAFMNHMTSPLMKIMALWEKPLGLLLDLIGIDEFLPSSDFLAMMGSSFCSDGSLTQILCTNALFAICGFSNHEMNATMLPLLVQFTPAGSSTKQFLHYAQEINSGKFRQYDWGMIGNMKEYGSISPPNYDLSKITAPVYIIYSHNDWLAAERDVEKLFSQLGNGKGKFLVSNDAFNHLDYMYGINAPTLVYNKVISLMSRH